MPRGARSNYKNPPTEPTDHGLGRSRGGWTTKIHLVVDALGRPLAIRITPGQAGDNPQLLPLLDDIAVPVRDAAAPTHRSHPDAVLADKAYSHRSTREALRQRRIATVIPEKSDQIAHRKGKGSKGGRPPAFDAEAYRQRNVVERCFNKIKEWRGIGTRYDKLAVTYLGGVVLAAIVRCWLR